MTDTTTADEERRAREREHTRRWREANPEKFRESQRRSNRKWRRNNPEKVRERDRRYRKENPEKVRAQGRKQARKKRDRDSGFRAYVIRFPALRLCYVGSTTTDIEYRLKLHVTLKSPAGRRTLAGRLIAAGYEYELDVFEFDNVYEMNKAEFDLGADVPPEERLHRVLPCRHHPRPEEMVDDLAPETVEEPEPEPEPEPDDQCSLW